MLTTLGWVLLIIFGISSIIFVVAGFASKGVLIRLENDDTDGEDDETTEFPASIDTTESGQEDLDVGCGDEIDVFYTGLGWVLIIGICIGFIAVLILLFNPAAMINRRAFCCAKHFSKCARPCGTPCPCADPCALPHHMVSQTMMDQYPRGGAGYPPQRPPMGPPPGPGQRPMGAPPPRPAI